MQIELNEEQKIAYNFMCSGLNIFITGGGGVGKSALLNYYIKRNKKNKYNIGITSTTGTSSILINGTTIHSYLGIGTGKKDVDSICDKINNNRYIKKRWLKLKTLIIDEISMLSANFFDKLEEIARKVRNNDKPFGGIQLILSGDFCQLSPVDSSNFCFEAKCWCFCVDKIVYLTKIIRQDNIIFQDCLSKIRLGEVNDNIKSLLDSRLNVELTNSFGIEPTKLFSKNFLVDSTNLSQLKKLCQKNKIYNYKMTTDFDPKIKGKYIKLIPALEILQLCKGCQVMLTYNLDLNNHLVNGSRGVVTDFSNKNGNLIPRVKFLNGIEIDIDFNTWKIEEEGKIIGVINQIPLKLGYAFSIHKAQGCSLDYAILDLSDLFDYGMAYVALSRVRNLEGLSILSINWNKIKANPKAIEFYNNLTN
tara:strand:+ start:1273 stop:2529 length:1257 start_codon:yes stop_codon:yes gene_type:complete